MKIQDLMTKNVCTCSPTDSLEQATRQMWDSDVGCLVVTDSEQKPIGMVTDRDIVMAAYTQGVLLRDAKVESAMERKVVTCSPTTSLSDVEATMRTAQIRRAPVIDGAGKLTGIIALGDIARSASTPIHVAELPGLVKTLAGVTQPRSTMVATAQ